MVFLWTHFRTHYLRFILARNYKGSGVDMDSLYQANLHFSHELQCFRGGHGFCETVRSESNRPRVLRDQKVLPEVRNRSLLVRDLVSYSNSEILLQSNRRTYSFIPSISDIPISLSCSLRSSSNRRLVISELHFDTRFKIYSSTIGVRNLVCYVPLGQ